jgi:outer membrane receptor for ferrienterochelin and colicins
MQRWTFAWTLWACLLGTPSLSQVNLVDSVAWSLDLDEAVVTGEKKAVLTQNALRIIRKLDLAETRFGSSQTLQDALRLQNGIRMSQDLALGSGISINGLGGLNVKIMVDGVPLVGRLGGNIDLGQIRLDDIQRIEIVEGPMAVEFGTNSLAGTINLISKRGGATTPTLTSTLRYESVGDYTQSASVRWSGAKHHSNVSFSNHVFDGWSLDDPAFDWVQDFMADSGRVSSWNPKHQKQLNVQSVITADRWSFTPKLSVLGERIVNRGLPRGPYGLSAFDDVYNTTRILPSIQMKSFGEDGMEWNIVASWQHFQRLKEGLVTDLTSLNTTMQGDQQQDTTKIVAAMTRGTRNLDLSEHWSARTGWDVNHEQYASGRVENGEQVMVDAAAFVLVTHERINWQGQLGLRRAWNSAFESPLLPSANILLKWGEHRIRGSYARGFRAPTLKELYFRFVDVNHQLFGNTNLSSENSNYMETSWNWQGNLHRFSLRMFVNMVDDRITLVDQLDGTYRYDNIATFHAQGVDIRTGASSEKWKVDGGFQWTGRKQELDHLELPKSFLFTPEWTTSITRKWGPAWSTNLNVKHNGVQPRYVTDEFDNVVVQNSEPYTMMDLQLRWSNEHWNAQLGCNNLLDITSVQALGGSGAHSSGVSWLAWGRSFAFTLTHTLTSKNDTP